MVQLHGNNMQINFKKKKPRKVDPGDTKGFYGMLLCCSVRSLKYINLCPDLTVVYDIWPDQDENRTKHKKPTKSELKKARGSYSKDAYETPLETFEFILRVDNLFEKLSEKTIIDPFVSNGGVYKHFRLLGLSVQETGCEL